MTPAIAAALSVSQSIGMWIPRWRVVFVVGENVDRRRVEIVELPAPDRPHERPDRHAEQQQADRHQQQKNRHGSGRVRRSALAVTVSDDSAMPSAAIHGVTSPATASGTASKLYATAQARFCAMIRWLRCA